MKRVYYLLLQKLIPPRHKLKTALVQVADSRINLLTTVPNINDARSFITVGRMSQTQKYNQYELI